MGGPISLMNHPKKISTKVKNYNLNVTEVLHPTFKKSFPGIFNFTVWILDYNMYANDYNMFAVCIMQMVYILIQYY